MQEFSTVTWFGRLPCVVLPTLGFLREYRNFLLYSYINYQPKKKGPVLNLVFSRQSRYPSSTRTVRNDPSADGTFNFENHAIYVNDYHNRGQGCSIYSFPFPPVESRRTGSLGSTNAGRNGEMSTSLTPAPSATNGFQSAVLVVKPSMKVFRSTCK